MTDLYSFFELCYGNDHCIDIYFVLSEEKGLMIVMAYGWVWLKEKVGKIVGFLSKISCSECLYFYVFNVFISRCFLGFTEWLKGSF